MGQYGVPVVWSPTTREHEPEHEIWVGVETVGTEVPSRVDCILEALVAAGHSPVEPSRHLDDLLLSVHDPELVDFLRTAARRWRAGPYAALVGQQRVVPYLFPTTAMTAGLPARRAV